MNHYWWWWSIFFGADDNDFDNSDIDLVLERTPLMTEIANKVDTNKEARQGTFK